MQCKFCGTENEEGAVYEGAFCPQCGSGAPKQKAAAAATVGEYKGYKNVLDIVKLSLVFTAIVIMLIFSFFVGIKLKAKEGSFSVPTSFTYLITQFKNISEIVDNYQFNGTKIYGEFYAGAYLPTILTAVAVGVNIIVCIVYCAIATVKFVKRFTTGEKVNLIKYLIVPAVTTLAAYAMVTSFLNASLGLTGFKVGLNGTSLANVIVVPILLAAAAVLQFVIDGNKTLQNGRLFKYIALGLAGIFTLVALVKSGFAIIKIEGESVGVLSLFMAIFCEMGTDSKPDPEMITASHYSIASVVVFFVLFVFLCLALGFILNELVTEKPNVLGFVFSIVSTVLAIGYVIACALFADYSEARIGYAPILALVMCVLALAAVTTWFIKRMVVKKEA